MKSLLLLLFSLICISASAQTAYYSTNGTNRLTLSEIEKILSERVEKISKVMDKPMFGNLIIEETQTKKDSIIHRVSFALSDKKSDKIIVNKPENQLKFKQLPEFNLETLNGNMLSSKELNGKPTMINFWFTHCAPCIDEMPALNKIAEKNKGEFNFIAITYETQKAVQEFLKTHSFNFKHLINAENFTKQLGLTSYPLNLFLDKQGVVRQVKNGIPYEQKTNGDLKMGDGKEFIRILEELR